MNITRRPIASNCNTHNQPAEDTEVSRESYIRGGDDSYEVFMLMDDTYCIAKFFAKDLDDAENQLFEMQQQYPNFAEGLYVQPFNESDDNFNSDNLLDTASNEVYSDLSIIFKQWDDNYAELADYYSEELPFASTQIMSATDDTESASVTDVTKESYIRGENIYDDISEDELEEYELVAYERGYALYRKVVDGRGQWAAQDQDKKHPPFRITYNQALGYEPIDKYDSDVQKLSRDLGRMLLPNSTTNITASGDADSTGDDFDTWYDSLDANAQSRVDDIADEAGIPFYDEATSSDLAWLRDMYESKYSADVKSSTELSDESHNVMYITVDSGINADGFTVDVVDPATDERLFFESYHYGYNASYNRDHADHAHKDVEDAKKYGWATKYTEKPFVTDIISELCTEYNIPNENIIVQAGKNRFSGGDVDDATVRKFKEDYLSASTSIESASYGGAYDTEDDMFFTKDEIVEWADSVVSAFNTKFDSNYILSDVYVDNNIIHIEISDADYVLSTEVRIDMRRIRSPKDIDKYIDTAVTQLEAEYSRIADCTYPESVTASTQHYDVNIPEFEDYVEFELGGMLVYVDESGSLSFNERNTYPDWDSFVSLEAADYPDVEIADMHQVIDDTSDLLESLMPRDPGVYQVYGTVSLCYTITGLVEDQTYYDGDEDPEREYDDRYINSTLNYGKSGIIDFVYNNA